MGERALSAAADHAPGRSEMGDGRMSEVQVPDEPRPIPTIDIAPFTMEETSESTQVVNAVRSACEEIGFFVITGHGFDEKVATQIYDTSRAFFDLPTEEKGRVGETGAVPGGLMHFGLAREALAATLGGKPVPDLKEALDYGPGFLGDPWPPRPPNLEPAWRACFEALSTLAATLRKIFAAALGLPPGFFEDKFRGDLSSLRVIDYPEQPVPPGPGQLRAGAHSDYGVLTILRTEDSPGGLQVRTRTGHWIDVPHIRGAFVINIGDAMMRWTNDRWVSTQHRVVNPPVNPGQPTRRQSIAYFHNPARDAMIECLPAFREGAIAPRYAPITYGEYARLRYAQAHGADRRLEL